MAKVDLLMQRTAQTTINEMRLEDQAAHGWYRFVLSYPPHLVTDYLKRFNLQPGQVVLDPFCGTGTTLVESKKHSIPSVGIEANPLAHFASAVKTDWHPNPEGLLAHARHIAELTNAELQKEGIADVSALGNGQHDNLRKLAPDQEKLILADSISPLPLHKAMVLLEMLERCHADAYYRHERLAFAKSLVFSSSNLSFGPEVGIGTIKTDAEVIGPWLAVVAGMSRDLAGLQPLAGVPSTVHLGDARQVLNILEPLSVDAVITSPPYPNEKDYTRTTRLESVLLGFMRDSTDLREVKYDLLRSNTRGVYQADEDDWWVADQPEIQRLAEEIENRRIELGKTSGFERMYARVTRLYFGGMARHLSELRQVLRPGAHLAYVVGDQASYLRVLIRTGQLLGGIAQSLGYELESIDLFRTRLATATRAQLREEVVVLRWPGTSTSYSLSGGASMPKTKKTPAAEKYKPIIAHVFKTHFTAGLREFEFEREDIVRAAQELDIEVPKNLGDLIDSFRYRADLPDDVVRQAPAGEVWTIQPAGRARYRFVLRSTEHSPVHIIPNALMAETKVPDATPGIIAKHALDDEQALLAKLRYNRLIDIFTGVTCYSLQNHLRTTVTGMGQVETDEIYVGLNRQGVQFVLPVQAKGGADKINIMQIEQDYALCAAKFPELLCIPIAAQFMSDDVIALFAFASQDGHMVMTTEKHYRLVSPNEVTSEDLRQYRDQIE
jgi:DNA modification methylase